MDGFSNLAIQLTLVAAAVTALSVFWNKGVKPAWRGLIALVHIVDNINSIAEHTAQLPAALPVLMDIAEEFKPNGGTSLRDRIDVLELGQRTIAQQLEAQLARDPESRTRITDPSRHPTPLREE